MLAMLQIQPTAYEAIDLISIIILYLENKNWYKVILTFATVKIPHITAPRDTRQKKNTSIADRALVICA